RALIQPRRALGGGGSQLSRCAIAAEVPPGPGAAIVYGLLPHGWWQRRCAPASAYIGVCTARLSEEDEPGASCDQEHDSSNSSQRIQAFARVLGSCHRERVVGTP